MQGLLSSPWGTIPALLIFDRLRERLFTDQEIAEMGLGIFGFGSVQAVARWRARLGVAFSLPAAEHEEVTTRSAA